MDDFPPSRSSYLSNGLESFWNVLDTLDTQVTEPEDVTKMFAAWQDWFKQFVHDHRWADSTSVPTGNNVKQPSLMRGDGEYQKKTHVYQEGFYKWTIDQMLAW